MLPLHYPSQVSYVGWNITRVLWPPMSLRVHNDAIYSHTGELDRITSIWRPSSPINITSFEFACLKIETIIASLQEVQDQTLAHADTADDAA